MDPAEVTKICYDYTLNGLEEMARVANTNTNTPFRFVYTSGVAAERDQTKTLELLGDYRLMRVSNKHFLPSNFMFPFFI
jgi:hypothetical protein